MPPLFLIKTGALAPVTFNEGKYLSRRFNLLQYIFLPLVAGNSKTCLAEPKTIVISESTAKKYFGKKNPVGQTLILNGDMPLRVTAVIRDVPENSHIKFDMLISFSTTGPEWGNDNWACLNFTTTYCWHPAPM